MKLYLGLLVTLLIAAPLTTEAKKRAKKQKVYFELQEAYAQRVIPGIPNAAITTDNHFVIKWLGDKCPTVFFWRGDNDWKTCSIDKAHIIISKVNDYKVEDASCEQIHKGDTLMITPMISGKFPQPSSLTPEVKNTLFFKTDGSDWLSYPVKKIGTKLDKVLH